MSLEYSIESALNNAPIMTTTCQLYYYSALTDIPKVLQVAFTNTRASIVAEPIV